MKRKVIALALVAGFGTLTSAALADSVGTYVGQVSLAYGSSVYSSGDGGEFQATLTLNPLANPVASITPMIAPQSSATEIGGSSSLTNPSIFQTFCIQAGSNEVFFTPNATYSAVIGTAAETTHSPPVESLNSVTQVLFAEFWDGSLPGYDFGNTVSRNASAGELQDAIWVSQGDYASLGDGAGEAGISDTTEASEWLTAAQTYVADGFAIPGGGIANLGDPSNYNSVQVMALYSDAADAISDQSNLNAIAQAQLVELVPGFGSPPVPLPAAGLEAVTLLGTVGLFGLVRRVRKLA